MRRSTAIHWTWLLLTVASASAIAACQSADESEDEEEDAALTQAPPPPQPKITRILSDGAVIWQPGSRAPTIRPGQQLTLEGSNFGAGPDTELSKIVIGNGRALERDIPVYKGDIHLIRDFTGGALYDEKPEVIDAWHKDIVDWSETSVTFRVPAIVNGSVKLALQVQKYVTVLRNPGNEPFKTHDPLADFLVNGAPQKANNKTVGVPTQPAVSVPIDVNVENSEFDASRKRGEAIFWAWDFNLGIAQHLADAEWDKIFAGQSKDPVTGQPADPRSFGAIYIDQNVQVPDIARQSYTFDPYPIANPVETLVSSSLKAGTTKPIGWVGYVLAEAKHPLRPGFLAKDYWIGFNCVSCHARQIDFEIAPGQRVSKVFTGLPNHKWTPKWTTFSGKLRGMKGRESAPNNKGEGEIDKTMLLYYLPDGATEATLIQSPGTGQFSNDFMFSPVTIPNITRHTPLRRALSRAEDIAGFEGSYLHPQAPEGTMGPMKIGALRDLTTYMTTIDEDHDQLVTLGMYEWLSHKRKLSEIGNASQGAFVQMGLSRALTTYPQLKSRVDRGAAIFKRDCQSCHADNFGTYTDERIFSFNEVGTYFSPSAWNRDGGGLRTAMLRELYWVQGRGMLHDGHVKSRDGDGLDSVELLINPDRCNTSSELFERMYTLGPDSFRIPKGTAEQERATRMQAYFVDYPRPGSGDESKYLYWDYQAMRSNFGPKEFGTAVQPLPQVPHPWCAKRPSEVDDLLHYLFTL